MSDFKWPTMEPEGFFKLNLSVLSAPLFSSSIHSCHRSFRRRR